MHAAPRYLLLHRLLAESERVSVPRDFGELQQLLAASAQPAVRGAAKNQQHLLQVQLMSEDWSSLTLELAGSALAAAEQLQAAADQQLQAAAAAGGAGGMDDEAALAVADDDGTAMSAESAASVLRFAAHWALALRALALVPAHTWLNQEEQEEECARCARAALRGRGLCSRCCLLRRRHSAAHAPNAPQHLSHATL